MAQVIDPQLCFQPILRTDDTFYKYYKITCVSIFLHFMTPALLMRTSHFVSCSVSLSTKVTSSHLFVKLGHKVSDGLKTGQVTFSVEISDQ